MKIFTSLRDSELIVALKNGAVGVLPTDTIYGLVCRAADETAVQRLYALKSRKYKPGTIIAADIEQLVKIGIKYRYLKAVEQYWPGSVSVILPCPELQYLHLGIDSLAVRIPNQPQLLKLLKLTGPLVTTSANQPDEPVANTIAEAQNYFGDQIDFYVDGGNLANRPPSTIIRVIDDTIEIVRPGAVTIDENGRITQ